MFNVMLKNFMGFNYFYYYYEILQRKILIYFDEKKHEFFSYG